MLAGRDDEPGPVDLASFRGVAVQGRTPAHRQELHARRTRVRIAHSWPDSHQRTGPALHTYADIPSPQPITETLPTDQVNAIEVIGIESSGKRPAQAPLAGWDGEPGAAMPDGLRLTVW